MTLDEDVLIRDGRYSQLIEENKSVKEMAHVSEVFLRTMAEALPQYVFWKNANSVYLGCNRNYATLVGLNSPQDIVGKTDKDLHWLPTGDREDTFRKGDMDTLSGRPLTNKEEVLALPNGKTLVTLVSKLPIVDNGKIIGIVGYFTDITEIKQKEAALIKANILAEAANQAKAAFIMNMSHDIRTPLTGILGMTQILSKELNTEEGKSAIQDLLNAEKVLLDLLNEVIEAAYLATDNFPVHDLKLDLQKVINDLVTLVTPSIKEKKLSINVDMDEIIPRCLIGDQTRIHRIMLNLLSNAIKFTKQGSIDIVVKLAKQENQQVIIKIIIKDTGHGISLENQEIIFSRFTRLEPSYKGRYKGAGLGLSIVKKFIDDIQGEIYVDSEEGQGSTFTCVIPLKKPLLDEL